jgi:hypothetical protein
MNEMSTMPPKPDPAQELASLREHTDRYIRHVVRVCGSYALAAKMLKIDLATLYRWRKKNKVMPPHMNSTMTMMPRNYSDEFRKELEQLINKHCMENASSTPDFLLAEYLAQCLANFDSIIQKRERWYTIRK